MDECVLNLPLCHYNLKVGNTGGLSGLFSTLLCETADPSNARREIHTNLRNPDCKQQLPCFCRNKTNCFMLTRLLTPQKTAGIVGMELGELHGLKAS